MWLINLITFTLCLFWKPQIDKTQSLNTLFHLMNLGSTAAGKAKGTIKIGQIVANMIQKIFKKLT